MSFDSFWHGTLRRPYRLHMRDHGGDGPVLVLLHGIAANSDKWSPLVPLVHDHYRVITIDLLGFGRSPKPQWDAYHMEDHLRHVHAAIRRLHLREPFTLAGFSLGSLLAARYAREHPRRLRRLLLLSPPVYAPLRTITSRAARQRTALYFRLYRFFRVHPRITSRNFDRLKHILPLPRSVVRNPVMWMPFERTLEHCIEQQTILADITQTAVPIDIMYGTLDSVIVPYNIEHLSGLANVRIHKLVGVNHAISKRYASAVAKLLLSA